MNSTAALETAAIATAFSVFGRSGGNDGLTTLMFHKIPARIDPLVPNELRLEHLEFILEFLRKYTTLLPLREAIYCLKRGKLPKRSVVLTFDDGYPEWGSHVAPLLLVKNIPATFFITTESLDGQYLWHERIVDAVGVLPTYGANLPFGFGAYNDLSDTAVRADLIGKLQERLKYAPLEERLATIKQLENQCISPLPKRDVFTVDTLRWINRHGFEIGAHTVQHPILNECTDLEAEREIGQSKEVLESIIGERVTSFAYPNGRPIRDYGERHILMVRKCGYEVAFSSAPGVARTGSDLLQLPRTTLWPASRLRMAYHFLSNLHCRSAIVPVAKAAGTGGELRCLMVASTFAPIHGGSAVVYENICRNMPSGSIRVLSAANNYLTHKRIPGCREYDSAAPFPIDRLPYLRPRMLPPPRNVFVSLYRFVVNDLVLYARTATAAARIVKKHRINVVCIGELVSGGWLGIALKRLFGCKLVIYVHGEEITTQTEGRLHGRMRRRYLEAADKVIAVSRFTCDALTKEMGLSPSSIALIENGVDTVRFTPGAVDEAFRSRLGLKDKRLLLFVGRLVPRKGVDMAIRALPAVVRQIPNVHFLVVGDGEYRLKLSQLAHETKMESHITFVGKVSDTDLLNYLRLCDVFIMPNRTMPDGDTEGFGLVFREANACRKPVIGGRAGGAVEAIIDGQTGLLVNGEDVDEISKAIVKILTAPKLEKKLAEGGLKVARANNVQQMAARFGIVCGKLVWQH